MLPRLRIQEVLFQKKNEERAMRTKAPNAMESAQVEIVQRWYSQPRALQSLRQNLKVPQRIDCRKEIRTLDNKGKNAGPLRSLRPDEKKNAR